MVCLRSVVPDVEDCQNLHTKQKRILRQLAWLIRTVSYARYDPPLSRIRGPWLRGVYFLGLDLEKSEKQCIAYGPVRCYCFWVCSEHESAMVMDQWNGAVSLCREESATYGYLEFISDAVFLYTRCRRAYTWVGSHLHSLLLYDPNNIFYIRDGLLLAQASPPRFSSAVLRSCPPSDPGRRSDMSSQALGTPSPHLRTPATRVDRLYSRQSSRPPDHSGTDRSLCYLQARCRQQES